MLTNNNAERGGSMKSVLEPTAMEIIEDKLVASGMSKEDATYLICKFLEEDATRYLDCVSVVEE